MAATAALSACGSDDDFANEPRPPSPINVTASITDKQVTVSPTRFGAGPIVMIIANQTDQAQRITVETAGAAAGLRQSTAPINPQGTAKLKLDVDRGRYTVTAGEGIDPADLRVGDERPSSQDELLQP